MWLIRLGDHLGRLSLRLSGFSSRFIDTFHGRVHYYEAAGSGEGPPIVFVHGIGANASHWGPVLTAMRRHNRRVIAIDLLAHGFSVEPADIDPYTVFGALADTIEALVDEPIVLVGNSLGGGLSLSFAMMRPERVAKLLLVSPGGAWMDAPSFAGVVDQFRMKDLRTARDFVRRLYGRVPLYAQLLAPTVRTVFRRPVMQKLVQKLDNDILHTPPCRCCRRRMPSTHWRSRSWC